MDFALQGDLKNKAQLERLFSRNKYVALLVFSTVVDFGDVENC